MPFNLNNKMNHIKGYRAIPIPLGAGNANHYFYIKSHGDKSASVNEGSGMINDGGSSLFIGNIDYIYNKVGENEENLNALLQAFFQSFGTIDTISISKYQHNEHYTYDEKSRFAHLTFMKKSSLRSALSASDQVYSDIGIGIAKSFGIASSFNTKSSSEILSSQTPFYDGNPVVLKESIAEFMREFDEEEESKALAIKKRTEVADEEGFVLVKPRSKRKLDEEVGVDTAVASNDGRKKLAVRSRVRRKERELQNFYRHQIREEKREKLVTLRQKFEEDKAKIAQLKAQRKFKPF